MVAEAEVGGLDEVEVGEDAVEEVLPRRPLGPHLLDQLLLVEQQDLHVERLPPPTRARKAAHLALHSLRMPSLPENEASAEFTSHPLVTSSRSACRPSCNFQLDMHGKEVLTCIKDCNIGDIGVAPNTDLNLYVPNQTGKSALHRLLS